MASPPPRIEAVLEGPAAQGRLAVDALVTLARELQMSLRRILSNRRPRGGRFRGAIEEVGRLDLIAFRQGSAVCTFELAPPRDPATLFGDQGVRAADELLLALEAAESGHEGWSDDVQPSLLESLDRLTRVVGDGIDTVSFSLDAGAVQRRTRISTAIRTHVQAALRRAGRPNEVRIEGVIWECDWRRHTAEMHSPDGTKLALRFSADLEEQVTAARRSRVVVYGRMASEGKSTIVDATRLEFSGPDLREVDPAFGAFSDNLSIDELAARQGVTTPKSLDELRGTWLDDEPIDDLLATIGRLRR